MTDTTFPVIVTLVLRPIAASQEDAERFVHDDLLTDGPLTLLSKAFSVPAEAAT